MQSQTIQFSQKKGSTKVERNKNCRGGLSSLRWHGMEGASRDSELAERSTGHALRLPIAVAEPDLVGGRTHPEEIRAL